MANMQMYIWRDHILTQHGDGMAVAVAGDIDAARKIVLETYIAKERENFCLIKDYDLGYDDINNYMEVDRMKHALSLPPEILDFPCAAFINGSE